MHAALSLPTALLTILLATPTSADFFVSNTSVCMGAFPVKHCTRGAKVLSNVSNDTKAADPFLCSHLIHAEDNNYVHNGTMAPFTGDLFVSSVSGVCGSGQLDFVKTGNDGGYTVNDKQGNHVGDCVPERNASEPQMREHCNQWVGMLFFDTAFKCTSSVCG